jgi:creatinine amidohydrolase/Fe(II)-dependent formamide hydrolase-like protein
VASLLFGIQPTDATTYGAALVVALPLAVLAAAVPAFRAARVQPMVEGFPKGYPKLRQCARHSSRRLHAGMDETSAMLFLRPDLVRPEFRDAPRAGAPDMEALVSLAQAPQWAGHLGSPRLATTAHGSSAVMAFTTKLVAAATSILDAASRRAEAERELKQRRWIERRID